MGYGAVAALRHCPGRACALAALLALMGCARAGGTAAGAGGSTVMGAASGGGGRSGRAAAAIAPPNSRFAMGGISAPEAGIRHYLARKDSLALRAIAGLPGDSLLRLLHRGMAYHRLGNWQASNAALQAADVMAEDRYTKSVKQALGAALINDKTIDYNPPPHERAFMHYYGMLNYLQLGDRDAALVEARKANAFLERYVRENGQRTYESDASVQYLAGMLHLAGGDKNDAIVSLRKAGSAYDVYRERYGVPSPRFVGADIARTAKDMGIEEVVADATKRYGLGSADVAAQRGSGQLLVLIENGYIAHRVQQKLYVPILKSEADALSNGGLEAALTVGVPIVDRTLTLFLETNRGNEYAQAYQDGYVLGALITGGDLVTMAWPKYSLYANGVEDVTVTVGTARQEALVMNDLSAIAARHFEEEKGKIVRRAVFRAAGKYALAKYAEKKAEQAADNANTTGVPGLGKIAGGIAKAGAQALANATEQADTRSWSSLPAEIRAARFTLPPGDHHVVLNVLDADGTTRTIDLGTVKVAANQTVVQSAFVDGQYRGSARRFANAVQGVDFRASLDVASGALPAVQAAAPVGAVVLAGAAGAGGAAAAAPSAPAGPGALATVSAVRPIAGTFRPLAGESARFAVQMRGTPEGDRRGRAALTLQLVRQGSTDTAHVWTGSEGDTLFWNGTIAGEQAKPGQYHWILRANTPRGDRPTEYAWSAAVEVEAPRGSALISDPPEPRLEPETRSVMRPDYAKKRSRLKWGLVFTGAGIGTSVMGYSMASTALKGTPPASPERQMAFNVWAGGITVSALGAFVASRGVFKDYEKKVDEPDGGAIQRNAEVREDRAKAVASVREQNESIRKSVVMRIVPTQGQGRKP